MLDDYNYQEYNFCQWKDLLKYFSFLAVKIWKSERKNVSGEREFIYSYTFIEKSWIIAFQRNMKMILIQYIFNAFRVDQRKLKSL